MANFADCVVKLSSGKGQYMREWYNPAKETVEDFLSRPGFPRFRGPMSKAEYNGILESIKTVPIISQPPKDMFVKKVI